MGLLGNLLYVLRTHTLTPQTCIWLPGSAGCHRGEKVKWSCPWRTHTALGRSADSGRTTVVPESELDLYPNRGLYHMPLSRPRRGELGKAGGGGIWTGFTYFTKYLGEGGHAQQNRLCKGTEVQRYMHGKVVEGIVLGRTLVLPV